MARKYIFITRLMSFTLNAITTGVPRTASCESLYITDIPELKRIAGTLEKRTNTKARV
jgi:hypothetical protein